MTILLATVKFFVGSITLPYSRSVIALCLIRTIAGIASGLSVVALPLYIAEIADPKIRRALGTGLNIFNLLGILIMNSVGSFVSIETSSFMFLTLKARNALIKSKGLNGVEENIIRLENALKFDLDNLQDIFFLMFIHN